MENAAINGLRIDLWLHRARFVKTRAAGTQMVNEGKVRLTRHGQTQRIARPGFLVRIGDVLSIVMADQVITVVVLDLPARRGPAAEARTAFGSTNDQV